MKFGPCWKLWDPTETSGASCGGWAQAVFCRQVASACSAWNFSGKGASAVHREGPVAMRANDPHPVEWMEAGGVPGILSEEVGGWPLSRQLSERAGGAQPETHFSHLFDLALPTCRRRCALRAEIS